jgi:bifunctional non-homologous end joining protein LigD
VLDGEICCLDQHGRSQFYRLMFRRDWPFFYAFDLLSVDGNDLRPLPLFERKRRLRAIMPKIDCRLLYLDHIRARGCALFDAVCADDLEGIIAKWVTGRYQTDGRSTSWLKIKNPHYTQMRDRRELFEARVRPLRAKHRGVTPALRLV